MAKKLADSFPLLHHSIYTEYRKWSKKLPDKHKVKDREELRFIVKAICQQIGKQVVERRAGVHVRGLGYFFVWKIPRKTTYSMFKKEGAEEKYNYHSDHHIYSPIWLQSIGSRKSFSKWSMDNSFNDTIKKGIYRKLKSGYKYKAYPRTINNLNRV